MSDKLRVVVGQHACGEEFRVYLGDEDITSRLKVRRVSMDCTAPEATTINLEVYADEVEFEALVDHVQLTPAVSIVPSRYRYRFGETTRRG